MQRVHYVMLMILHDTISTYHRYNGVYGIIQEIKRCRVQHITPDHHPDQLVIVLCALHHRMYKLLHGMYYALHKHNVTRYLLHPGCVGHSRECVEGYVTLRYSMLLHVLCYVLSVYACTLHHLLL